MNDTELEEIHSKSTQNRHAIESSDKVGCFCCERVWDPLEFPIKEWIDSRPTRRQPDNGLHGNATGLCPFCGVDSIVAKLSVGEITVIMLDRMEAYWFGMKKHRKRKK